MRWFVGFLVAGIFLAATLFRLDDFGVTWDFGQVGYGDRYLHCLLHAKTEALDFERASPLHCRPPHPNLDEHRTEGPELVWPLGPILSSVTALILFERLDLLPPIAARHAASLLATAALLFFLTIWFAPRLGLFETITGVTLLALHPSYLWHSLANFKDPPAAAACVIASVLCVYAIESGGRRSILTAALAFGVALAAKGNAWILPVTVLLALFARQGPAALKNLLGSRRRLSWLLAGALVVAPLVAFALWPWMWTDPIHHLRLHVETVLRNRVGSGERLGGLWYAAWTSPEVILAGFALSLPLLFNRLRGRELRMLWTMALVPVVLASLPGAKHYDSVRRYLEFVPPLALSAGAGFGVLRGLLIAICRAAAPPRTLTEGTASSPPESSVDARSGAVALLISAAVFSVPACFAAIPVVRLHPDQHLYYNSVCGGLSGARSRGVTAAIDYWGHSYRRVFEWLAKNAPPNAAVHTPTGPKVARLSNELWGRPDLQCLGEKPWHISLEDDNSLFVAFVERPEYYNDVARYALLKWEPELEVNAAGESIARVYAVPPDSARRSELFTVVEFARKNAEERIRTSLEEARALRGGEHFRHGLLRWFADNLRLHGFDRALKDLDRWRTEEPAAKADFDVVRTYVIERSRFLE